MFSEEQRRVAIETFIRYDHSYADTVAELGYLPIPSVVAALPRRYSVSHNVAS